MVKDHFLMGNEIASVKVTLMKYLLPQPFDVREIDVFEKPMQIRVFGLEIKFIISDKTLFRNL